jgi:hypothetical protein
MRNECNEMKNGNGFVQFNMCFSSTLMLAVG